MLCRASSAPARYLKSPAFQDGDLEMESRLLFRYGRWV
jgi:hypothetical protein